MSLLTRRRILELAAALLPVMACSSDTAVTEPLLDIPDDAVMVRTERIRALDTVEGAVVLLAARVIVIRTGVDAFRALSADCPHAGCGVSIVDRPRLICPCHGSEFDFNGNRLGGPAPTGLRVLQSDFDITARMLRISRSHAA